MKLSSVNRRDIPKNVYHELGHAVMSRAFGHRVSEIKVGGLSETYILHDPASHPVEKLLITSAGIASESHFCQHFLLVFNRLVVDRDFHLDTDSTNATSTAIDLFKSATWREPDDAEIEQILDWGVLASKKIIQAVDPEEFHKLAEEFYNLLVRGVENLNPNKVERLITHDLADYAYRVKGSFSVDKIRRGMGGIIPPYGLTGIEYSTKTTSQKEKEKAVKGLQTPSNTSSRNTSIDSKDIAGTVRRGIFRYYIEYPDGKTKDLSDEEAALIQRSQKVNEFKQLLQNGGSLEQGGFGGWYISKAGEPNRDVPRDFVDDLQEEYRKILFERKKSGTIKRGFSGAYVEFEGNKFEHITDEEADLLLAIQAKNKQNAEDEHYARTGVIKQGPFGGWYVEYTDIPNVNLDEERAKRILELQEKLNIKK